jgi:hypothetical protein
LPVAVSLIGNLSNSLCRIYGKLVDMGRQEEPFNKAAEMLILRIRKDVFADDFYLSV